MTVDIKAAVERLIELAAYLLKEADFNRSWIDGRRGVGLHGTSSPEYIAWRIELAEERETWARDIRATLDVVEAAMAHRACYPAKYMGELSEGEKCGTREHLFDAVDALGGGK